MCLLQILLQQKGEWTNFAVVVGWHIPYFEKIITPEIITANNHHACHRVDSKAISHPVAERQLEMRIAYTKLAI